MKKVFKTPKCAVVYISPSAKIHKICNTGALCSCSNGDPSDTFGQAGKAGSQMRHMIWNDQ